MKKFLIGTTALVAAAGLAAQATADTVELGLGGYAIAGVAFGEYVYDSNDIADTPVHIIRDGEVHFKGSGTLDNGIKIEARVEIEIYGDSFGDVIDENWVRVTTGFGSIMIGGNDSAVYNIGQAGALFVGADSIYDGSYLFTPGAPGNSLNTPFGSGDRLGIHYYTPNLFGLTLGVSWQPDWAVDGGGDSPSSTNESDNDDNRITFGARYQGEFEGASFEIGGGLGFESRNITSETGACGTFADGDEVLDADGDCAVPVTETNNEGERIMFWRIGAQVEFDTGSGTLAAGGNFQRREESDEDDSAEDVVNDIIHVGVTYGTGPWSFGVFYTNNEAEDNGDELWDSDRFMFATNYELGAGVNLSGNINYGSVEGEDDLDESGVGGGVYLTVDF